MRLRELAVCAERKQKDNKTSKTHKELNITVGINRTHLNPPSTNINSKNIIAYRTNIYLKRN